MCGHIGKRVECLVTGFRFNAQVLIHPPQLKDQPIHDAKSQSPTHYNKNYCDVEKRFLSLQKFKQSARRTDIDDSVLQKYAEAGFYNYGFRFVLKSKNMGTGW
jgi:hypothetical protein